MKEQIFKPYEQSQMMLLLHNLKKLIPPSHLAKVVDKIIEPIGIELLIRQFKCEGKNAFHPKMPVKGIVYAYIQLVFLSR